MQGQSPFLSSIPGHIGGSTVGPSYFGVNSSTWDIGTGNRRAITRENESAN